MSNNFPKFKPVPGATTKPKPPKAAAPRAFNPADAEARVRALRTKKAPHLPRPGVDETEL